MMGFGGFGGRGGPRFPGFGRGGGFGGGSMGYCEERHLVKMRGLPFRVTENEIAEVNSLRRKMRVGSIFPLFAVVQLSGGLSGGDHLLPS